MTSTAAPPTSPRSASLRRWVPVAVSAVVWWFLYSRNRPFWDWAVFDVAGLDADTRVGESVHFFFYDVTKIALLLSGVIFVVTLLRSLLRPRLIATFVGVVATGILLTGYLFNAVIPA